MSGSGDPFQQQQTPNFQGPLGSAPEYVSPYEVLLGMPPGNEQIANVLGPIRAQQLQDALYRPRQRRPGQCVPQAQAQPLTKADMAGCLQGIGLLAVLGAVVIGLLFIAGGL